MATPRDDRLASGIPGLDEILLGGFPPGHSYLVQGRPGSGKTTLGLQFAMEGARRGETVLYVTNCETIDQLEFAADSHAWSLEGIDIRFLDTNEILGEESKQSLFHANEVAFPRTLDSLMRTVEEVRPVRLVLDSLTEWRLLAAESRAFRRELLSVTRSLTELGCTTLLFDDTSVEGSTLASVVNGLVDLEQIPREYGPDRRRLRVRKLRGTDFRTGYHDARLQRCGLRVFPRLEQSGSPGEGPGRLMSSGIESLDALLGGGIVRGSSVLLQGSTGCGKSTVAAQIVAAAAERGENSTFCALEESRRMLLRRADGLGIELAGHVEGGAIGLLEVDPAELTPGEFSEQIRRVVEERDIQLLVIDSLNGYVHAMNDGRMLLVHLHELFSYLGSRGVTVLAILAQHDTGSSITSGLEDLSYISDTVLLFRHFEHAGELRHAVSVYKNRGGSHERTIHELTIGPREIHVGEPLTSFQGVLRGSPRRVPGHHPESEDVHDDERG